KLRNAFNARYLLLSFPILLFVAISYFSRELQSEQSKLYKSSGSDEEVNVKYLLKNLDSSISQLSLGVMLVSKISDEKLQLVYDSKMKEKNRYY
ncbi:hypothetical protein VOD09_00505, partial [Escherichia coli]|nr:hypothetical protein [Escherichia coli]